MEGILRNGDVATVQNSSSGSRSSCCMCLRLLSNSSTVGWGRRAEDEEEEEGRRGDKERGSTQVVHVEGDCEARKRDNEKC